MSRADDAYRAIARHYDATGRGMTYRELAKALGITLNPVYMHVKRLEEQGRIMPRKENSRRTLAPRGYFVTIDGERFIGEAV